MLRVFQKYERIFFFFIAVIVIASFTFFGTFGTFVGEKERKDRVIGEKLDGSQMMLSEVQLLSRFLAQDCEDQMPNLCNDGVIRRDFVQTGIADLLAAAYFEPLKEELGMRLERAKRFRHYSHPQAPYLDATLVWLRFFPALFREYNSLREEGEAIPKTFFHFSKLYQQQGDFPPELLRQCLMAQQKQQKVQSDPRLSHEDLSLFGFQSAEDWFGRNFLDLASEFILNGAALAKEKGFQVSLEEAKGDLMRNFQISLQKFPAKQLSLTQHLQSLGFDEKSAVEIWRNVLQFRRYFRVLSEATLIDRLPYRNFASYARETAIIDLYRWPIALKDFDDFVAFQAYLKAISPNRDPLALPTEFYSPEEVENTFPELVQATYRAQGAEISKREIALRAPVKEVWDWEFEHWDLLREKFSFLPEANSKEERFAALEKLVSAQRARIDSFARFSLLDFHPEWVEQAVAAYPLREKIFLVSKRGAPFEHIEKSEDFARQIEGQTSMLYSDDGKTFYRLENIEKVADQHILTFEEAKEQGILEKIVRRLFPDQNREQYFKDIFKALDTLAENKERNIAYYTSHRLLVPTRQAYEALQKDPFDPHWVKREGEDPLREQFKLERTERQLQRTTMEEWMKEQSFGMEENQWSPIHVVEEGEISFFYLRERRPFTEPIFEQLSFGKELICADAQKYLAEQLLKKAEKKEEAFVLPLLRVDDESF